MIPPPSILVSIPKSSQTSVVNGPVRNLGVCICRSAFCSGMNFRVLSATPVGVDSSRVRLPLEYLLYYYNYIPNLTEQWSTHRMGHKDPQSARVFSCRARGVLLLGKWRTMINSPPSSSSKTDWLDPREHEIDSKFDIRFLSQFLGSFSSNPWPLFGLPPQQWLDCNLDSYSCFSAKNCLTRLA